MNNCAELSERLRSRVFIMAKKNGKTGGKKPGKSAAEKKAKLKKLQSKRKKPSSRPNRDYKSSAKESTTESEMLNTDHTAPQLNQALKTQSLKMRGDSRTPAKGAVEPQSSDDDALTKVQWIEIDDDTQGQRVDNFLFRQFKGVPKSRIYRAIRDGEIRINKKRVKPDRRIENGDLLRLPPLRQAKRVTYRCSDDLLSQLEDAIVFESSDLIVINKPTGLAVHGGSGINTGLIEALRQMRPDCKRLELVHRLDRDTSGCTMVAKKSSVLRYLHQQLREKTMQKTYWALVKGRWPVRKNLVDLALERYVSGGGERMVRPSPEGKISKTGFKVLEPLNQATLVEAKPITGRTHQIRVHTQASGHPILGDVKYGIKEDETWEKAIGLHRLFLHAAEIAFRLPDSDELHVISAPLPADLQKVVLKLRQSS